MHDIGETAHAIRRDTRIIDEQLAAVVTLIADLDEVYGWPELKMCRTRIGIAKERTHAIRERLDQLQTLDEQRTRQEPNRFRPRESLTEKKKQRRYTLPPGQQKHPNAPDPRRTCLATRTRRPMRLHAICKTQDACWNLGD